VRPITGDLRCSPHKAPRSRRRRDAASAHIGAHPALLPRSPGTIVAAKYGGCLIPPRLASRYDRLITVAVFTMKGSDRPDLGRGGYRLLRGRRAARATAFQRTGRRGRRRLPRGHWRSIEGTVVSASSTVATSFVPTMDVASVTKIHALPTLTRISRNQPQPVRCGL
jgi:hypothetical protein